MRTLLISATLLALVGVTPVLAQSYAHATSQYDDRQEDRQDSGYDDRQAPQPRGGQAYDGRGAASGGYYGYQDADPRAYRHDAYRHDGYRPAPRRRHRAASAPVSRYAGFGNPVYYDDGMIRTGRDYPVGTVGLAYGRQERPQICTVRRTYYDADQGRYRVTRRRVPCAEQGLYEEE